MSWTRIQGCGSFSFVVHGGRNIVVGRGRILLFFQSRGWNSHVISVSLAYMVLIFLVFLFMLAAWVVHVRTFPLHRASWLHLNEVWFSFFLSFFFLRFWPHPATWGTLVSPSGIKPTPPALKSRVFNHWTTKEVLRFSFFISQQFFLHL